MSEQMQPTSVGEALPPPDHMAAIVGAMLSEIEGCCPGFFNRVVERIEDASLRNNVIRLRGRHEAEAMRHEVAKALRWLDLVAVSLALRPAKRWRKKWRH